MTTNETLSELQDAYDAIDIAERSTTTPDEIKGDLKKSRLALEDAISAIE